MLTNFLSTADVGLQLNIWGEKYKTTVLKFLKTARDHDGGFDKLRRALGLAKTAQSVSDGYPRLTETIEAIMNLVSNELRVAVALRDRLLDRSSEVIKEAVYELAERDSIAISDTFCGRVLTKRVFMTQEVYLRRHDITNWRTFAQ